MQLHTFRYPPERTTTTRPRRALSSHSGPSGVSTLPAPGRLLGIGILVEILPRLGFAFVTVRAAGEKAEESTQGCSAKGADDTASA